MSIEFDHRIQGIPCIIKETFSGFDVLDRTGYQAPWLERKMTVDDVNEVYQLLEEYIQDDIDESDCQLWEASR